MIGQFDVFANVGSNQNIPFVVVVQSSVFEAAPRRVVVPLIAITAARLTPSRMTPEFEVAGRRVMLQPLEITSVPVAALQQRVGSLKDHGQQVIDALDELLTQAFG